MTFAQRVLAADTALYGRCPTCLRLNRADPSMRVTTTCDCGRILQPRRVVGCVEFTSKESN